LDKIPPPKHQPHQHNTALQTATAAGPETLSKSNSIMQSQKQLKASRGGDKSMPPNRNAIGITQGAVSQQHNNRLPNHHGVFVPQSRAETQSL